MIRSSPFHTEREEEQRKNICELIRSYGIKIAEIEAAARARLEA